MNYVIRYILYFMQSQKNAPASYHHNAFVETWALMHMIYGYICVQLPELPQTQCVNNRMDTLFFCVYIYIYIYIYIYVYMSTLCVVGHL